MSSGQAIAREPVQLPDGFVTMLLTDVEGSTNLVRRLGDRYGDLLNDLRVMLRDTAVRFDGNVVETRADEFFAVFEQPRSGVETAVAIQRELRARTWVDDLDVRIRIGIHSGYPTLADANYIGMPVHTAARIERGRVRWTDSRLERNAGGGAGADGRRGAIQAPRRVPTAGPARRGVVVPGRGEGTRRPVPGAPSSEVGAAGRLIRSGD